MRALEILLIEDNPGDARLIEEMLRDASELLQRVDLGDATAEGAEVYHEQRLDDGLERLSETDADVVLLDLGLPDSNGLDTLAAVADETEFTPIVVLTGLRDEQVGVDAIQHGAQDYLVKDEVTSELLVRSIHYAIERNHQERERARRREQLEALNRLNRVGQDVSHAVITASSREELEQIVCERLVESGTYELAWIGEVDRASGTVTPTQSAGVDDGYLDEITITVEGDETAEGPTGKAVRNRSVHVMRDVLSDPEYEPWRDAARERGFRSSAAVPVIYEEFLYGVLNIYSSSPNAFTGPETEILSRLGDVIGHAITAIERKDALVSDTVLELEFRAEGVVDELVGLASNHDAAIEIQNVVHSEDDLIAFGRTEIPQSELREAAERTPEVDDYRILTPDSDECEFELVSRSATELVEAIATHGGRIKAATIAGGELRFVTEFPPGRDKRQLVELVETHCEGAESYAQRTVERPDRDVSDARSVLQNRLTEKQRTALETAYFAGLFDWPRKSTGEEVADRLGITASTFTQHLRAAEREFFDAVFEGDEPEADSDGNS